jgi:hypothetical protein
MSDNRNIFISYSRRDQDFVQKLVKELENVGLNVWIDNKGLVPGTRNWEEAIREAIASSRIVIFVASPEARKSNYVQDEIAIAEMYSIPLIPVWASGDEWLDCIPLGMGKIQFINAKGDLFSLAIQQLLSQLNGSVSNVEKPTAPSNRIVINENEIASRVSLHSNRMIGIRYKEKYNQSYYHQRTEILSHYTNFLNSDKVVMVLTGKAGTGKSTFICDITTSPISKEIVWLQDCAHLELDESSDLQKYILTTLSIDTKTPLVEFLDTSLSERKLIFLFDAVNEYSNSAVLLEKISDLALQLQSDKIKIFITCRIPIWHTVKRFLTVPPHKEFHTAGPNSYVSVEVFQDAEIKQIYEKYRKAYNLPTAFEQLSVQVVQFITQPLFLKLTAIGYQGRQIPRNLVLQTVFDEYVAYCLRSKNTTTKSNEDVKKTEEYKVLSKAIDLMYHSARRELETALLRSDDEVGHYFNRDNQKTPYFNLLNEGILTEKLDDETANDIELVFVTYERVFEYLLANIIISPVTVEKISQILDIARSRSFIQLRGAAELALAFAIVKNDLSIESVIELAHLDRPESRQFLCDTIQTIYASGNRDIAIKTISTLIDDENLSANLLAVQATYQLKLDNFLVDLAMSKNEELRSIASLFVYQRWNTARLTGNLEDAYKPLIEITKKIRLRHPMESVRALSALSFITFNLLGHIVEDKPALNPLLDLWRDLASKVPGLESLPDSEPSNRIARMALDGFLQVGSQLASRMLKGTVLDDIETMSAFWTNSKHKRAFMDNPILHYLDNMVDYKESVINLLTWDHSLVRYITSDPLIHHTFHKPEIHLPMLQEIFDDAGEFPFRLRFMILHAFAYALFFRVLKGKEIPEDFDVMLEDNLIELWYTAYELDDQAKQPRWKVEGTLTPTFQGSMILIMLGIFSLEYHFQKGKGKITGSKILRTFLSDTVSENMLQEDKVLFFTALERQAYQGSAEFAIKTLLDPQIRNYWEKNCNDAVIKSIAQMRSFFQDEIDSIILTSSPEQNIQLMNAVRSTGALPDVQDVLFTNTTILILSSGIEPVGTQVMGALLIDIISSNNLAEMIRRGTRTFITAIFDFEALTILIAQWYLAHYPNWNGYEKLGIQKQIMLERSDIHTYWKSTFKEYVEKNGRGIFFGELD